MRHLEELSVTEIAAILDIPPGTASSLNYRWSLDTGMQLIDDLSGFATHTVCGLFPDGRYVIGRSSTKPDASRNRRRACWIWSPETGTRVISQSSTATPRYVSSDGQDGTI